MPLNTEIGGSVKCIRDMENICLTMDQDRHIYKKVELEGIVDTINVDTIKQEIEKDKLSKSNIDDEEDVNPYHNIIINNIDRET